MWIYIVGPLLGGIFAGLVTMLMKYMDITQKAHRTTDTSFNGDIQQDLRYSMGVDLDTSNTYN